MLSGSRCLIAAAALLAFTAGCSGSGSRGSGACQPAYALQYDTGYRTEAVAVVDGQGSSVPVGNDWITREPTFSPDGRKVAVTWFDSAYESRLNAIAIFDVGSQHRAIVRGTSGGEHPAWSPDGSTIAYAFDDDRAGAQEVRLVDAATGRHNHAITYQPGRESLVISLAWSRSGNRLAFIANDVFSGPATVWVVDRSGTELHRVASFTAAEKVDQVSWRPSGAALLLSNGARAVMLDLGTSTVQAIVPQASEVVPVGITDRVVYDTSSSVYRYVPNEGTLRGARIRRDRDLTGIPPRRRFRDGLVMAAACTA